LEGFTPKDAARKAEILHTLFLENEAQINEKNYTTMLFMSKQLSLPKISSILQKFKIGPKCHIRPFCMKPFNYERYTSGTFQETIVQGMC